MDVDEGVDAEGGLVDDVVGEVNHRGKCPMSVSTLPRVASALVSVGEWYTSIVSCGCTSEVDRRRRQLPEVQKVGGDDFSPLDGCHQFVADCKTPISPRRGYLKSQSIAIMQT